ncbi:MAG: hypothetical protein GY820_30785 [Gammaproteobacteria bacterium]|nr:hypothetical protein [Gammaproteobacteria bacterium]
MTFEIIHIVVVFIAGLYMLGIGYSFLPNPGKKGSVKNEEHFNKHRKLFKVGGVLSMVYAALQSIYIVLGYVQ